MEMVSSLRGDMDILLVFASLFSAVVTAFVIDSYKSLGGAASGDTTVALFQQLLLHMKEEIPAVTRAASSTSPTATTSSICIMPCGSPVWFSVSTLSLAPFWRNSG
ncbi:hypothetical protein B0H13DRAFT_2099222 [Mycena leptocephala]|nr:hypothetical protein B0H13DRAFT_2099222 [Mycena leptocephala]